MLEGESRSPPEHIEGFGPSLIAKLVELFPALWSQGLLIWCGNTYLAGQPSPSPRIALQLFPELYSTPLSAEPWRSHALALFSLPSHSSPSLCSSTSISPSHLSCTSMPPTPNNNRYYNRSTKYIMESASLSSVIIYSILSESSLDKTGG